MYKAVIFDLDGTLLDTLEDLALSSNHVLHYHGKDALKIEKYNELVGEGANSLLEKILPHLDKEGIKNARVMFEKHYATQFDKNTKVYEGISKVLTFFQTRGYKMAVLSNKPNNFTKKCVLKYLINWNFELVYGIREGVPKKPNPQGATEILKELNVSPKECLYIGDTKTDMITASRANITSIGVLWGFRDKKELVENGANYIAEIPSDIIKLVSSF